MALVPLPQLKALEASIQRALTNEAVGGPEVIGYGEITSVVRLRSGGREFACKRLVPFPEPDAARRCVECIQCYVQELGRHDVDVVETQVETLRGPSGESVVMLVQPGLRPETLGPSHVRSLRREEAVRAVDRIFERIRASVSERLAPDGQLSNWAFVGERLLYLDVSTPFLRDASGRERFDFTHQTRLLPAPLRPVFSRFLLQGILDHYHSLRGQALDFLGNLHKEGLAGLIPELLPLANQRFGLTPNLTTGDVLSHYRKDARTYALIQAARRADRWWHGHVLRRPYPYLLPPRIERGL